MSRRDRRAAPERGEFAGENPGLLGVSLEASDRRNQGGGPVQAVASPRTEVRDERIWNLEIRVDGNFATAWMNYAFYLDDRFSHCGINSFQLFRGVDGWRIVQVTDTRRREGCQPVQ